MKALTQLCITLLLFTPQHSNASALTSPLRDCQITTKLETSTPYDKENITPSNNLRQLAGSTFKAAGTPITLSGKLTDEHCQAISNASITIWHHDSLNQNKDPHFANTGKTYSNNQGHFSFHTIMPSSRKKHATPLINIRVQHPDFDGIQTIAFFPGHPTNQQNNAYANAVKNGKKPPILEIISPNRYHLPLTLKGTTQHKEF